MPFSPSSILSNAGRPKGRVHKELGSLSQHKPMQCPLYGEHLASSLPLHLLDKIHDSNNLKGSALFGSDCHRFLSALVGKATPLILVGQKAERSGVLAFNWLSLSPLSFYPDFLAIGATHL